MKLVACLILALLAIPAFAQAGAIDIKREDLALGAIELLDCKDGQPIQAGCVGEYVKLTWENYHEQTPVPGSVGLPPTPLYQRVAASPYVTGAYHHGIDVKNYFGESPIDYVRQKDVAEIASVSQWMGNARGFAAFDLLRPYEVFRVGKGNEEFYIGPWKLKGKWFTVQPATCIGVNFGESHLFDSKGGACIPGKKAPQLVGGWESVAVTEEMLGKKLTDSAAAGSCIIDRAWGMYNPARTPSPSEGQWARLLLREDSRTITEEMLGTGLLLHTAEGRECALAGKGYANHHGRAANLASGFNFISVTNNMVGKSFDEVKGNCNIEEVKFYFPKLCDAARLKDPASAKNVCQAGYAIIDAKSRIHELNLGKGFWVAVSSSCTLATDERPAACPVIASREGGRYCSLFSRWESQKAGGQACSHNFECASELCVKRKCATDAQKAQIEAIVG